MPDFRYLAHTADLRAEIRGRDRSQVFSAAVDLLRDALVGSSPVQESRVHELDLDSADDGEQLFRFLRELVYLYDAEGFVPHRLETSSDSTAPLRVFGESFDPERHRPERQIKALTRHDFIFEHGPDGYRAVVLFDL